MSKKKRKKKNKNMRKREIHKMQIENQQEERVDTDKEQAENQQKILADASEKEERRTTRSGVIIAIVAIIGVLFGFLFKMIINLLNIWSIQGIIYWYLKILFLLAFSAYVIIFFNLVLYLMSDLQRYNTLDQNYKQYDQESDEKYERLLKTFKIYMIMLFCVFTFAIPVFAIYESGILKWIIIVFYFGLLLVGGIILVLQWRKHKNKEENKDKLRGKELISILLIWAGTALVCSVICFTFIENDKAMISVSYSSDGIVEICNGSAENYKGLDLEICNLDGKIIYTESVEREKLLFAREDTYVSKEVDGKKAAEGILLNSEHLYWRYIFDLKEVINESGNYAVSLTVYQNGKRAFLCNSFSVANKEYIFAKDSMEKDY